MKYDNYVYPGQPMVIALRIMQTYPSLSKAKAKGKLYSEAAENPDIPGAGFSVSDALYLLEEYTVHHDPTQTMRRADDMWKWYPLDESVRQDGLKKCDLIRQLFTQTLANWDFK